MPFFFAWVPNGGTAFGVAHHVEDEEPFAFGLDHTEGDFCSLKIAIVNPRVGLLNDGRPRWAWVSYKFPDNTVVPMFHGRLVGFPQDMTQKVVTLEFLGRPADYETQKKVLADTLRVDPYYDPIFVDETLREDPDVVLAARPQLWHIGRTDKVVSVSNVITGEDGFIGLNAGDIAAGSLHVQYSVPISKVHVEGQVNWDQRGQGTIDVTKQLLDAFKLAGSAAFFASSYTGQGLEASWPRHNDNIGGGWSVYSSLAGLTNTSIQSSTYLKVKIDPSKAVPDFTIEEWWADSAEGYDYWYKKAYDEWLAAKIKETPPEARFYLWTFKPTLTLAFTGRRGYSETVKFDVVADMQELLTTDDEPPKVEEIKISSQSVSEMIDGSIPIGQVSRNSYFRLDRGKRTINYLMNLARAKMLFAARAVSISVQVPFETALNFSCRKDIILTLPDLPGGVARGKIIGYSLQMAAGGKLSASVTFACTIGRGNVEDPPADGDPVYANPGYMNDYQAIIGGAIQPIAGDLTYNNFKVKPNDDGLDLGHMTAANSIGQSAATALLTFASNPVADKVVHIGPRVYTWKAALTAANQVLIGGTKEASADNLAAAINADEDTIGILFGAGTIANTQVSATAQDGIVRVTARVGGVGGNALAVTSDDAGLTWDHPTLTQGSYGMVVINGQSAQAAWMNDIFGTVQEAIDHLNEKFTEVELTMKPIDGGPFETDIPLTVSKLMVPKTIDLEAAAA